MDDYLPEVDAVEDRFEGVVDDRLTRLDDGDGDGDGDDAGGVEDPELAAVLEKHTHNEAQHAIGVRITREFVTEALEGRSEQEVRALIGREVVVPERVAQHQLVRMVLQQGARIVRDDWGDRRTENAVVEYAEAAIPQTDGIPERDLRAWIRLQLDWARWNLLRKPPLERADVIPEEDRALLEMQGVDLDR